ncbi:MAG: preprotein translocase subunit SecE [Thermoguttaceae bacterium]|jgi:preprotein translocase subunit SecE|nr:preprotein translocase subunit SecE [Thermoguttaceae bacterium]
MKFLKVLLSTNLYKSSQGRIVRRSTFVGLTLVFLLGSYNLFDGSGPWSSFSNIAAILVAALGTWFSFRMVNYPTFADFLVSVEAEMNKVSWPSKKELLANTKVVLIFMLLFTILIYVYDVIFAGVFSFLKI